MDIISKLELFDDFTKEELSDFFKSSKYEIKKYTKDQIIHLQNEHCNTMDIILEGKVSIQKIDEQGNVFQITQFLGGDFFGANLIFSSRNSYPMTVVSESNVTVLSMYKELIIMLGQSNTKFLLGFLSAVSDITLVLTDKIESMSLKTIRQKIFDFLKYEYSLKKNPRIDLNFTKKEFAERLGIQRTSLSRELNKMRNEGLILFDSKSITIIKIDELK
ncbi:MAG: Crp/Fnr family transcriptional regulator [Gudongella sp.]|nr:Crp/Fnr family transcriptional regulator [Gudongella sp.]